MENMKVLWPSSFTAYGDPFFRKMVFIKNNNAKI